MFSLDGIVCGYSSQIRGEGRIETKILMRTRENNAGSARDDGETLFVFVFWHSTSNTNDYSKVHEAVSSISQIRVIREEQYPRKMSASHSRMHTKRHILSSVGLVSCSFLALLLFPGFQGRNFFKQDRKVDLFDYLLLLSKQFCLRY